jgi:hypothetical protein
MKSNIKNTSVFAQFREGIIGSLIGIVIEVVNYAKFEHSPDGAQLALIVALVGVLLAVLRSALQLSIDEALAPVTKLAEIVDLQMDLNVDNVQLLLQRYLSVTEPEFKQVKEQIVADATEKLRRLAIEKRSATLQTTDYYDWLFRQFDLLAPGEYVHAVSLSSDTEWNDSQLEKNFLAKNLEAAKRGVLVSRIFIVEEKRLEDFLKLPPIHAHTKEADTGLQGFYVSRNNLELVDREALAAIGEGFIDFNGHVALEDRFDTQGLARGDVTMLSTDLN